MNIIGIDAATQPSNTGLALGHLHGDGVVVSEVVQGSKARPPATGVKDWLSGLDRALLAIDAPLGWPYAMGPVMSAHRAGEPFQADDTPDSLFHRETDRVVKTRYGKRPLEVGADRIARTAHAAVTLLKDLCDVPHTTTPLAWEPTIRVTSAIEVYPAATLAALGLGETAKGYKKDRKKRVGLLDALLDGHGLVLGPGVEREDVVETDDALDAMICSMAGMHFLQGAVVGADIDGGANR